MSREAFIDTRRVMMRSRGSDDQANRNGGLVSAIRKISGIDDPPARRLPNGSGLYDDPATKERIKTRDKGITFDIHGNPIYRDEK